MSSLRSSVLRGSTWTTLGHFASRLLRLGSNLVLARLLFPEAFGLMALVNVVLMGVTMLSDVGLVPSIVQSRRGDDEEFLGTAWSIQIGRGFVLWLGVCLLTPGIASFYGQPELARLLPVATFALVISGFNSMAIASFRRHLRLEQLVKLEIASQLIGIAVMVAWAWLDRSVWALVAGGLAGAASRAAMSHWIGDVRDRLRWDADAARELIHFGKWIFASTLAAFLSSQLDRLIFGKTIPIALLGVYGIAAMMAALPGEILARLGSGVVFPALSRKQQEPGADLRGAYRQVGLPLAALAGLTVAPLAAAGSALIETLYDPRYAEAGWIVQLLACGAWFQALEVAPSSALMALGRPQWVAAGHAAKVVGIGVGVPLGFALGGFPGAVVGLAASQVFLYAIASLGAYRNGLGGVGADLSMTALVAASTAGGWLAAEELARAGAGSVVRLVVGAGVPVALWLGLLAVVLRVRGQTLRSLIAGPRSGSGPLTPEGNAAPAEPSVGESLP